LPYGNRLWDNFIQEELQDDDLHPKKRASEDDMALAARMKGKEKDSSKVKCFNCGEMGHFSSRCPMKKKGYDDKKKGKEVVDVASSAEIYALTGRLEEDDFAMISHFSQGTINEDGLYVAVMLHKWMRIRVLQLLLYIHIGRAPSNV